MGYLDLSSNLFFLGRGMNGIILYSLGRLKGLFSKGILKILKNGPNEIFLNFQWRAGKIFQKKEIAPGGGGGWVGGMAPPSPPSLHHFVLL